MNERYLVNAGFDLGNQVAMMVTEDNDTSARLPWTEER
ncbi:hypothetical protein lwe0794 [Listeria welshimeri serovar 6b str. SLCC5334]|uniref:Uncharacterized protein n=1 Tax=Listeria welshimeri serovar 6b (strain ATCC 35897 / DSM 20650 / CCUG 15529 / CIP 8149 / NCTC 11857 / SLCC 5334 / V8) TaxID=386043 RepID=A0AGT0_LISW6|nr:hypothetical protein lwe0794 [Listeria welshimeri serovar 6b str. SLCC5334]